MMRRCLYLLWLTTAIGCVHAPPRLPTGLSATTFWKEQARRAAETERISGKLTLRYQTRKNGVYGRGRILAEMPKRARLELRDPLGRLQYQLTLEGRHFIAYYPTQKLAYIDEQSGTGYLRRFMGMNVTFAELESLFTGVIPFSHPKETTDWEWDDGAGYYRGRMVSPQGHRITVFVDGVTAAVQQMTLEIEDETIEVGYSDFGSCCGTAVKIGDPAIQLADTVAIHLKKSGTAVELEWQELDRLLEVKDAEMFAPHLSDEVHKIILN